MEEERKVFLKKRKNARAPEDKWQPSEWKPIYQEMVVYKSKGLTNIEIGRLTNFTPQQVMNILTSEAGKYALNKVVSLLEDHTEKEVEELGEVAMRRVRDLLEDDLLYEQKPFAIADRSMTYLRGINKLKSDSPSAVTNNQQNIIIGDEAMKALLDGLSKSDRARQIHQGISGESIN